MIARMLDPVPINVAALGRLGCDEPLSLSDRRRAGHRFTWTSRLTPDLARANVGGMSKWHELNVLDAVLTALADVPIVNPDGHHFARPWVTAYQLAIKVDAIAPDIALGLGVTIGGQGTGSHTSLSQYLARQLSGQIKEQGEAHPVEGAFLSNDLIDTIVLKDANGQRITSSVTHSGYDLSLYRLRT